jgi:hypothetical protein
MVWCGRTEWEAGGRHKTRAAAAQSQHSDPGEKPPARASRPGSGRSRHRPRGFRLALQAFEVGSQLSSRLIAHLHILFQGLAEDPRQLRRRLRVEFCRWTRFAGKKAGKNDRGRRAGERLPARGHLIQHHAERKQIGARVHFQAPRPVLAT